MPKPQPIQESFAERLRETEANLAIEGLYLTDEERELLSAMEAEGLSPEARIERIKAFCLEPTPALMAE
jgi:hypothetical protein